MTTARTPKPAATQPSRPRLAFLRGRSWKFYVAAGVLTPLVIGSILVGYYYVQLSRLIDARMHGEFQRTEPRIFARPFVIRRGQRVTQAQMIDRLNDLGYAQRAKVEQPGEFAIGRDALAIMPRAGDYPGKVVRLVFAPVIPRPVTKTPRPEALDGRTGGGGLQTIELAGRKEPLDAIAMDAPLLTVTDLKKYFRVRGGVLWGEAGLVRAVDGVSFTLRKGETLGLVGESGCGKSTTGRCILRLLEPTAGRVVFDGLSVFDAGREEMRRLRRQMQIIFQDPYSSLNPRMSVEQIVGEGMVIHRLARGAERRDRTADLLRKVGLSPDHMKRYPHEFSGGQRQRIGIARALAVSPSLIIADEPISALDVSIQAQVLNLLQDLQEEFGLTYLFIAHDLRVVEHISDRVAVMYLGQIVELADSRELYRNPLHPYTQALMSAIPIPDPTVKRERVILKGDPPSPLRPPSGCRFHTRCPKRFEPCDRQEPVFREVQRDHWVSCHLY